MTSNKDAEAEEELALVSSSDQGNTQPGDLALHPKFAELVTNVQQIIVQFQTEHKELYASEMKKFFKGSPEQVAIQNGEGISDSDVQNLLNVICKNPEASQSPNEESLRQRKVELEKMVGQMDKMCGDIFDRASEYLSFRKAMFCWELHNESMKKVDATCETFKKALGGDASVAQDVEKRLAGSLIHNENRVQMEMLENVVQQDPFGAFKSRGSPNYQGSDVLKNPAAKRVLGPQLQSNLPTSSGAMRRGTIQDRSDPTAERASNAGLHQKSPEFFEVHPGDKVQVEFPEEFAPRSVEQLHSDSPTSSGPIIQDMDFEQHVEQGSPIHNENPEVQGKPVLKVRDSSRYQCSDLLDKLCEANTFPRGLAQSSSPTSSEASGPLPSGNSGRSPEEQQQDDGQCLKMSTSSEVDRLPIHKENPFEKDTEKSPNKFAEFLARAQKEPDELDEHRLEMKRRSLDSLQSVGSFLFSSEDEEKSAYSEKGEYRMKLKKDRDLCVTKKGRDEITLVGKKKFMGPKKLKEHMKNRRFMRRLKKSLKKKKKKTQSPVKDEDSAKSSESETSESSDEEWSPKMDKRRFGFLDKPLSRGSRFDNSPTKKSEGESMKMTGLEKQLNINLEKTTVVPNSHRKRSYVDINDDEYEGYEVTKMKFEYKHLTFDINVPSLSRRTHWKEVWGLDQVNNGFEASMVKAFKLTNPEEYEDILSKYLDFKKDEAEAEQLGVAIEAPSSIVVDKHRPTEFSIKNRSKNHAVFYVVSYPDALDIGEKSGQIAKGSEVKLTAKLVSRRRECECVHVGYHWGEEVGAPRLSKKISVIQK